LAPWALSPFNQHPSLPCSDPACGVHLARRSVCLLHPHHTGSVAAYSNQAWQVRQLSNQAWLVRQLKGLGGHLLLLVLVAQGILGLRLTVKKILMC